MGRKYRLGVEKAKYAKERTANNRTYESDCQSAYLGLRLGNVSKCLRRLRRHVCEHSPGATCW